MAPPKATDKAQSIVVIVDHFIMSAVGGVLDVEECVYRYRYRTPLPKIEILAEQCM